MPVFQGVGFTNAYGAPAIKVSQIPNMAWDGSIPFSVIYANANIATISNGVTISLLGTGHTIDNKGSIYTNMDKVTFNSFDANRTINIAQSATINELPRLDTKVTLQSQSTSFVCVNPTYVYVGEQSVIKSDSSVIGVKFISLSGFSANCTFKLFDGSISGANVVAISSLANIQVEMFIASTIDAAFISGTSGNLILYYAGNIAIPARSAFVSYTGSIYYSPATNANELYNTTQVTWSGGTLWSDFYLEQDMANLDKSLVVVLSGSGHTINNRGSVYVKMHKISFLSLDVQRTINIAQGATLDSCPSLISGVILRSQSTVNVVTNPVSATNIGINCILSTDTGAKFLSLTGSTSHSCTLNSGTVSGSQVFDLAGTSSLTITMFNISQLSVSSIYGIVGTTLNLNYSSDSPVYAPSSFVNFLGSINYLPSAISSQVKGGTIEAVNLAALQTFKFVGQMVIGQWGIAQDTKKAYLLSVIDPLALNHTWIEYSTGGSGDISGTLTVGKIPVATGPKTIADSALTQSSGNVSCSGQLTASNLSGTNTGDQDLTNLASNQTIGQLPGSDDRFYFDTAVIRALSAQNEIELKTLTESPSGSTELTVSCYATSANSPVIISAFLSTSNTNNYYGISAGLSIGKFWCAASEISGTAEIIASVMRRTPCNGVVTMTGSGTSRTVTATQPIFFPSDANTDKTVASYLYTPVGVYQITAYTSPSVVTISVPAVYVNETNVAVTRIVFVYKYTSGNISTTTIQEKTFFSDPNGEFTPATSVNWTPVDQVAVFLWGKTTVVSTNKIDVTISGKTRYSHVEIPSLIQIKSAVRSIEPSVTYGSSRRSRPISGTGSYNFDFTVPEDFKKLLSAHLVGYPSAGAAGTGRTISTSVEYNNNYGEAYNIFTASELNVIYDLTTFANKRFHLPFTNNLSNIRAGGEGGVTVNHVSVAGTIDYTALEIIYI